MSVPANTIPNAFFLSTLPPFTAPERDGDTVTNFGPDALWSGTGAPPKIGERVLVTMNGLGPGTVKAYFIESGWLGVHVALEAPPAWWVKQNAHVKGVKERWSMLFGIEVAATSPL